MNEKVFKCNKLKFKNSKNVNVILIKGLPVKVKNLETLKEVTEPLELIQYLNQVALVVKNLYLSDLLNNL